MADHLNEAIDEIEHMFVHATKSPDFANGNEVQNPAFLEALSQTEDFKQWNARRLNINPSGANYVIQIVSSELSLLKTKLVCLDKERIKQLEDADKPITHLDYSSASSSQYREQLVFVIKALQSKRSSDKYEALGLGRRLCWLMFVDPVSTMMAIFKLLIENSSLVENFTAILTLCRECLELKVVDTANESNEILCSVYVLKKMLHQHMTADLSSLRQFGTLMRQLSRSIVKIKDKQQHLEFVALIPATCVITDLLLSLPLTPLTADFILALLNHMFSTTKETHVFVVEWKKPVDGKGPYILPHELLYYALHVHNYTKEVDPTRAYNIPYVFKSFGTKLSQENVLITETDLSYQLLNQMEWSERFAIIKALGSSGSRFCARIPVCLYESVRYENKKHYRPFEASTNDEERPLFVIDFFESLLELAAISLDHALMLLDHMRNPLFIADCNADQLRAAIIILLVKQTKKSLTLDNYRNLVQLLGECMKRFEWPLDLMREAEGYESNLLSEIASKYELVCLIGMASFIDIGNQVTSSTIESSQNPSTVALATCFLTESNRVVSDLVTRFVVDQIDRRIGVCPTPQPILKVLSSFCDNILTLAKKLNETPLELSQMKGFIKRIEDFVTQINKYLVQ